VYVNLVSKVLKDLVFKNKKRRGTFLNEAKEVLVYPQSDIVKSPRL